MEKVLCLKCGQEIKVVGGPGTIKTFVPHKIQNENVACGGSYKNPENVSK